MSISYHGIVGYGKATLPSVETWSTNMNILRDPPKSITTRKIDKVGETSEITQMIQESGDRCCEAIQVYARGVNPMVSVSYDNFGNNGGQKTNGHPGGGKQSFLPYRVMRDGAFRPPVRDQRDLLPLSRLPRVWTSSFSQPGFADFSKKLTCQGTDENTKGVKKEGQILKACIRPTATYQVQTPIMEPFEVKNVIKNPLLVQGHSGYQSQKKINGQIGEPIKEIIENPNRIDMNINMGNSMMNKNIEINVETDKYLQDNLTTNFEGNRSKNIQITTIDELYNMETGKYLQETLNVDCSTNQSGYDKYEYIHDDIQLERTLPNYNANTNQSGYDKYEYIHDDIQLERTLPNYNANTNTGYNIHKKLDNQIVERQYVPNHPLASATTNTAMQRKVKDNNNNTIYNLKPTINIGGMNGLPTMPTVDRGKNITEFDTDKVKLRQRIYDMQQERNTSLGQLPYQESVM